MPPRTLPRPTLQLTSRLLLQNPQADLASVASCILRCLLFCSQEADATATAVVQHLLLEAIPAADIAAVTTLVNKQLSVQLMLLYAGNGSGKLASKVGC